MIRLFVPADLNKGAGIDLGPDQAHYLINVMRQAEGAEVLVFNGRDGEWRAMITEARKKACRLTCVELTRKQEAPPDLELVVALVKRSRLETIIEKSAELGARRVRLVVTQHTNSEKTKIERLRAIATEAAEQTGRLDVPEIDEPVKLKSMIEGWDAARALIFCDEAGDARPMLRATRSAGSSCAILIGPEGGFSAEERKLLRAQPFVVPATLGPRILRADSAAIAALALWQAAVGDWRE